MGELKCHKHISPQQDHTKEMGQVEIYLHSFLINLTSHLLIEVMIQPNN